MQCTQWTVLLKLARLRRPILGVCSQGFSGTHLVGCLLLVDKTQDPRLNEVLGILDLHQQKRGEECQRNNRALKTPYGQRDERRYKVAVESSERPQ